MKKLVKEHINEKFTEDSDPIKDMGIGYREKLDFHNRLKPLNEKLEKSINAAIRLHHKECQAYFEELLVGKKLTGNFIDLAGDNYRRVYKTIEVKGVEVIFSKTESTSKITRKLSTIGGEAYNIAIISKRGKKYYMSFYSEGEHEITL